MRINQEETDIMIVALESYRLDVRSRRVTNDKKFNVKELIGINKLLGKLK